MKKIYGIIVVMFGFVLWFSQTNTISSLISETTTSEDYIPSEIENETTSQVRQRKLSLIYLKEKEYKKKKELEDKKKKEEVRLETSVYTRVNEEEIATSSDAEKYLNECKDRLKEAENLLKSCKNLGYNKKHPARVLAKDEINNIKQDIEYYQQIYNNLFDAEQKEIEAEKQRQEELERQKQLEEEQIQEKEEDEPKKSSSDRTYLGSWYVTGYTDDPAENGGWSGDCMGNPLIPWYTCASDLPLGTMLYVEGVGTVEVRDRGVSGAHLDIAVNNKTEAYGLTGYYDVYMLN